MEIEQLAVERPEALARIPVDASEGVDEAKAAEIVDAANFPAEVRDQVDRHRRRSCGRCSSQEDATLVEVNPLAKAPDGTVLALDGKVTLDENAGFRHPEHAALDDNAAADPLEAAAKEKDLNYVKLDGEVGIIGNGAGLVMSTLDVVAYAGEEFGGVKPANFLDIGGGASAEVMANGLEIILSDPAVKSVFVNVFGGITACDAVANGIVAGACEQLGDEADQAARRPARRQQRRGGPAHPRRGRPPAGRAWSTRWTAPPRRAAELAADRRADRTRTRWRSSSPRTARSSSRA